MKAAVVTSRGNVEVTSVPDPVPAPREVVIGVASCGICGTDLHILAGEFAPTLPVVPGHEFAGEVVAVGTDVTELAVGDRVGADPNLYCGECYYCRRGRDNLCERFAAIGVTQAGAAAEFTVAPVANCVKLPEHVRPEDAALIEPLSCVVHAFDVLRRPIGDHYLVYGSGTMGLMVLQVAKAVGAASVDVVDINPERLQTARQLGCTNAVSTADEIDRPRGWDVVIDCTGAVAAIEDGLQRVGKGGTFLQFGVSAEQAVASWSPYKVFNQEISILGSMAVLHSYERAAELFATGLIDPNVFISHRHPLQAYPASLRQFADGIGRKIVITPQSL